MRSAPRSIAPTFFFGVALCCSCDRRDHGGTGVRAEEGWAAGGGPCLHRAPGGGTPGVPARARIAAGGLLCPAVAAAAAGAPQTRLHLAHRTDSPQCVAAAAATHLSTGGLQAAAAGWHRRHLHGSRCQGGGAQGEEGGVLAAGCISRAGCWQWGATAELGASVLVQACWAVRGSGSAALLQPRQPHRHAAHPLGHHRYGPRQSCATAPGASSLQLAARCMSRRGSSSPQRQQQRPPTERERAGAPCVHCCCCCLALHRHTAAATLTSLAAGSGVCWHFLALLAPS